MLASLIVVSTNLLAISCPDIPAGKKNGDVIVDSTSRHWDLEFGLKNVRLVENLEWGAANDSRFTYHPLFHPPMLIEDNLTEKGIELKDVPARFIYKVDRNPNGTTPI